MWRGWALVATIVLAVTLSGTVIALLLFFDTRSTGSEAVKTGGLVAGGVVALYALWLNDRRRQLEESRHELERRSNEQDRERVADERFARAVELLGHEADQVRVGALHALIGLARNRPSSTQTVLDVLCSYLRRPFDHPDFVQDRTGERPEWAPEDERDAHRERQVRLTAQRLIGELLPASGDQRADLPDLDLTAAVLDYLDVSGKALGRLLLRDSALHGTTRFGAAEISGEVWFTRTACYGKVECANVVFRAQSNFYHLSAHDRVTFEGARFCQGAVFLSAEFHGPVSWAGSTFEKSVDLRHTVFHHDLDLRATLPPSPRMSGMKVNPTKTVRPPAGWEVHPEDDGRTGRIRPL
ncbi:MAG: pentapeptide repeat-containing protein [Pseudonocardiaceae bacterium]